MPSATRAWIVLAFLYAVFFGWYTSFGGPLTQAEIDRYLAALSEVARSPEALERWRHFMETDTGDDFAMLNAIEMRETPLLVEGVAPGETSAEVLSRYTTPFLSRAFRSAAHPVLLGTAAADAMDVWGIEGAEHWSTGGLIRYRSRRDLLELALLAGGSDIHRFKTAAMAKTIAFPIDPWFQLGDPRLVLALVFAVIGLGFSLRASRAGPG